MVNWALVGGKGVGWVCVCRLGRLPDLGARLACITASPGCLHAGLSVLHLLGLDSVALAAAPLEGAAAVQSLRYPKVAIGVRSPCGAGQRVVGWCHLWKLLAVEPQGGRIRT